MFLDDSYLINRIPFYLPVEQASLMQVRPDVGKGLLLALLRQHGQQLFQQGGGLRMHQKLRPAAPVILQGGSVRIVVSLIDLTGGDPVHQHLDHIAAGHLDRDQDLSVDLAPQVVVHPVLVVVAVAALMVEPGAGVADGLPLRVVGAAVALPVSGADHEFRRRELGQVMQDSLAVEAYRDGGPPF